MHDEIFDLIQAAIERLETQQTQILTLVGKLRAAEPLGLSNFEEVAISLNPRSLSSSSSYSTYASSYTTNQSQGEDS